MSRILQSDLKAKPLEQKVLMRVYDNIREGSDVYEELIQSKFHVNNIYFFHYDLHRNRKLNLHLICALMKSSD